MGSAEDELEVEGVLKEALASHAEARGELVKKNAQFVERIARIAEEYGRPVATPDEARKILNLPRRS